MVEPLPSAQGIILGSLDGVQHEASCREPAPPSAGVPASLCVSIMNKIFKKEKKKHSEMKEESLDVGALIGSAISDKACGSSLRMRMGETKIQA